SPRDRAARPPARGNAAPSNPHTDPDRAPRSDPPRPPLSDAGSPCQAGDPATPPAPPNQTGRATAGTSAPTPPAIPPHPQRSADPAETGRKPRQTSSPVVLAAPLSVSSPPLHWNGSKTGQITCYINRTDDVLPTIRTKLVAQSPD